MRLSPASPGSHDRSRIERKSLCHTREAHVSRCDEARVEGRVEHARRNLAALHDLETFVRAADFAERNVAFAKAVLSQQAPQQKRITCARAVYRDRSATESAHVTNFGNR